MTGRNLIASIIGTTQDLDAEIPVSILYRNEHECVTHQQKVNGYTFINGKLRIEGTCLGEKERYR